MWNSKARYQPKNGVTTSSSNRVFNSSRGNKNINSLQQQPAKILGLTSAISLDGPRPEDLQNTEELCKALEVYKVFESEEELIHRMEILAKLNCLFSEWVKEISLAKNIPKEAAQSARIHTFGSYRLGVHHKDADIDTLCVAPRHIERSEYFTSFFELLKQQPEVTECRAIEEAFVPVIKMNFDGIEIDLLFARLSLNKIPNDFDMRDNNLLRNLDPHSVRSLNGCRVTDEILSLVPNIENFCLTLRSIKLWAKRHGIYSNTLGYFGGVSWAILVARTCQLYPNATSSTLVHKFFMIFSRWKWPGPVLLKRIHNVNLRLPVWDPRVNLADRYHLMPIITPAYPQLNSTFNVTESTKKVILMEINRGMSTIDEIMLGKASWDRLFEAPSFFYRYNHFIVLLVNSYTADDHLEWCGLVESKIRFLIGDLDRNQYISLAHVNPKCFDQKKGSNNSNNSCSEKSSSGNEDNKSQNSAQTTSSTSPYCSMWFIGLEFERIENLNVDLTGSIRFFAELVTQHGATNKMLKEGMSIDARHVKRKQLSQYLDAGFLKRERKSMDSYNSVKNSITAKRKRPSNEIQQKDVSNGNIAKRSRVSESHEENSNASSDVSSNTTPTTPNSQQQTAPTFKKQPMTPQQQDKVFDNSNRVNNNNNNTDSAQPTAEVVCSSPLHPHLYSPTNKWLTHATLPHQNAQTISKNNNAAATANSSASDESSPLMSPLPDSGNASSLNSRSWYHSKKMFMMMLNAQDNKNNNSSNNSNNSNNNIISNQNLSNNYRSRNNNISSSNINKSYNRAVCLLYSKLQ